MFPGLRIRVLRMDPVFKVSSGQDPDLNDKVGYGSVLAVFIDQSYNTVLIYQLC